MSSTSETPNTRHSRKGDQEISKWEFKPDVLIYKNEEFIVGLDEELDLDWETTDVFDQKHEPQKDAEAEAFRRVAQLHSFSLNRLDADGRLSFRRMIGESVVHIFRGNISTANKCLDDAKEHYFQISKKFEDADKALLKLYENRVVYWKRMTRFLRVMHVFRAVIGVIAQAIATVTSFSSNPLWTDARGILLITAGAVAGLLHVLAIDTKASRFRDASRSLEVAMQRFSAGELSRKSLIDAFEAAERQIGSVEFPADTTLPASKASSKPNKLPESTG